MEARALQILQFDAVLLEGYILYLYLLVEMAHLLLLLHDVSQSRDSDDDLPALQDYLYLLHGVWRHFHLWISSLHDAIHSYQYLP
jgi:hypothetical protein